MSHPIVAMSKIKIQCAIKIADSVQILQSEFEPSATITDALDRFSSQLQIDLRAMLSNGYGISIFGKKRPLDTVLQCGDRIEICAPLIATPMDSRRRRAKREHKGGKM
jgi:putative ubiquitin-RnfH superfamily antitoxin RatB of RatAB toxin-antitoxin module